MCDSFGQDEERLLAEIAAGPKLAEPHFRLAQLYWDWGQTRREYREDKQYCHRQLLYAVKIDQNHAPTFRLLGELLHTVFGDKAKAQRCLIKCFTLDPTDLVAAKALAQHFAAAGNMTELTSLCDQVLEGGGSHKWALQRLGVAQQGNDLPLSIASLQRAVRCDPDDMSSWQELAQSYSLQGKYACATKVLSRILSSTNNSCVAATYQKGRLHLLLGDIDEAIGLFEQLTESLPSWPPGLLGLGEGLLRRSLSEHSSGWLRRSLATLKKAVCLFRECIRQQRGQPHLLSAWKLLGDGLLNFSYFELEAYHKTAQPLESDSVGSMEELPTHHDNISHGDKSALLLEASRAFSRIAFMHPTSAAAWHDLGICAHARAKTNDADGHTAVRLVSAAIKQSPCNAKYWTSMGTVHPQSTVGLHAFVRALQLDEKSFTAWENLGMLYLQNFQTELAYQAFSAAKRLNPSSPASWTGLARVLERQGNLQDAKFTYGQSLQLNPSQAEALLGYANCVAKLLSDDVANCNDLHAALAHVSQYLQLRPNDAHGHNLRGMFLYTLALPSPAVQSFTRALELSEQGEQDSIAVQSCTLNLGHANCCRGDYSAAERGYRRTSPSSDQPATAVVLAFAKIMQGNLAQGSDTIELPPVGHVSSLREDFGRLCMSAGHCTVQIRQWMDQNVDLDKPFGAQVRPRQPNLLN